MRVEEWRVVGLYAREGEDDGRNKRMDGKKRKKSKINNRKRF